MTKTDVTWRTPLPRRDGITAGGGAKLFCVSLRSADGCAGAAMARRYFSSYTTVTEAVSVCASGMTKLVAISAAAKSYERDTL